MKQEDTKQRILDKALELFSTQGYDAVSVGEIAKAVGIKAPSLYNHFPSKQAIFDAIMEFTAAQYEADTDQINIHVQNAAQDIPVFTEITADVLFEKVRQIFEYSLHNETISRFRRMMTIEAVPLTGAGSTLFQAICGAGVGLSCRYLPGFDRGGRNHSGGSGYTGDAICFAGIDAYRDL